MIRVEQKNKSGDALPCDDVAQVVLPPPKLLSVLVVTDGNYYLERGINSLGLKNPVTMLPTQYEQKHPTDYDVIVFDRYSPAQLPATGNFMYFGAVAAGLEGEGRHRRWQTGDDLGNRCARLES